MVIVMVWNIPTRVWGKVKTEKKSKAVPRRNQSKALMEVNLREAQIVCYNPPVTADIYLSSRANRPVKLWPWAFCDLVSHIGQYLSCSSLCTATASTHPLFSPAWPVSYNSPFNRRYATVYTEILDRWGVNHVSPLRPLDLISTLSGRTAMTTTRPSSSTFWTDSTRHYANLEGFDRHYGRLGFLCWPSSLRTQNSLEREAGISKCDGKDALHAQSTSTGAASRNSVLKFLQRFDSNAIRCIIFVDLGHKVLQCLDGVIDPESGKGVNHYFLSG